MDPVSNMPVVVLRDAEGGVFLPIWVGIFEANAIAIQMEKIATPRPMTHDLLKNLIGELDATVERIVINDLRDNTFFARIHLLRGETALGRRQPAERRDRARAARGRRDLRRGGRARKEQDAAPRRRRRRPRAAEEVARGSEPGGPRKIPYVVGPRGTERYTRFPWSSASPIKKGESGRPPPQSTSPPPSPPRV